MSEQAPVTLVDHPLSPYAQKLRIMLREKDVPFASQVRTARTDGITLTAINPRSEVPVLLHEGSTIFDSTIIAEYLEDRFPAPALMPPTPATRARARMIEDVGDTQWEAVNWGVMEVRFFGRGAGSLAETLIASAREDTRSLCIWLENQLDEDLWLGGGSFGWADAAILPHVTLSAMLDLPAAGRSRLDAWLARCMQRPSVAATVAEARAALPQMEHVGRLLEGGGFRRQYRDHRLEWMIRAGGLDVVVDGLDRDNIRFTDLGDFTSSGKAVDGI